MPRVFILDREVQCAVKTAIDKDRHSAWPLLRRDECKKPDVKVTCLKRFCVRAYHSRCVPEEAQVMTNDAKSVLCGLCNGNEVIDPTANTRAEKERKSSSKKKAKPPDEEFYVKCILSHRQSAETAEKLEYLICWEGYADDENTWEPLESFDTHECIRAYVDKLVTDHGLSEKKWQLAKDAPSIESAVQCVICRCNHPCNGLSTSPCVCVVFVPPAL